MRQILKVDPRVVSKICIKAVDPLDRYSNETQRANIYDVFKWKKTLVFMVLYENISALLLSDRK